MMTSFAMSRDVRRRTLSSAPRARGLMRSCQEKPTLMTSGEVRTSPSLQFSTSPYLPWSLPRTQNRAAHTLSTNSPTSAIRGSAEPFATCRCGKPVCARTYHVLIRDSLAISGQGRRMMSKAGPEGAGQSTGGAEDGEAGGAKERQEKGQDSGTHEGDAEYDPYSEPAPMSIPYTIGFIAVASLALGAVTATVYELLPRKMAPQSIMSRAHDVLLADPDTANHYGTPLKVYGRDNNSHREGRRNFVEHVDHVDPVDGSSRMRIRFNVEGPNGHGMAYAEVSNKMSTGEWVYLCVQDMQTGHVITLHDNRAMLIAQAQAGSEEEKSAFRRMLGQ